MADLSNKLNITVEELEERLGEKKLPEFIKECEQLFLDRVDSIVEEFAKDSSKKAVFVSGPTSSGKTTFTMRLAAGLSRVGRKASFLSLDDYYKVSALRFDKDGRPDFESIDTLDIDLAAEDVRKIISGQKVIPPRFNFKTRLREQRGEDEAIELPDDGVLVVEGLHGLSEIIAGAVPSEKSTKVFIMPYGNVFCDTKLLGSNEIRMLRRIVRDNRHRGAHAMSTVDYWPMIKNSEEMYYEEYLTRADVHVNSFLGYESLVIAPLALQDIRQALEMAENNDLKKSIFMTASPTGKNFADLSTALATCSKLLSKLEKIPVIDPSRVPEASILNEFISE